jgi:integrase
VKAPASRGGLLVRSEALHLYAGTSRAAWPQVERERPPSTYWSTSGAGRTWPLQKASGWSGWIDFWRGWSNSSTTRLRHTFITRALEAGAPIGAVAKAVGHSTVYITEVYGHISDRAARSAAEAASNEMHLLDSDWLQAEREAA